MQAIFTYPNADKTNEIIINEIKKFINDANNNKYIFIKNAGAELYSNLLRNCSAMIGNSSSGIVEAATFSLPAINIGNRQKGKVMPKNVIQTNYNKTNIFNSIIKSSKSFYKKGLKKFINPYENRITSKKIANIIANIKINDKLKVKKFQDL